MRTLDRLTSLRRFRSRELFRLMSMIFMLPLLLMLMWRAGDPTSWYWLTGERRTATPSQPAPLVEEADQAESETVPGPTDEDQLEFAAATQQFEAIADRASQLKAEEMPAYWRLFSWVEHQSYGDLKNRVRHDAVFNDFVRAADSQRGRLVALELNVRRVLAYDAPENSAGVQNVYELWGWTTESRAWPYVIVTAHLPTGMAVGADVRERVSFCGYFFKLQGYQASGAGPHDKPLMAPLLVGRLSRHAPVPRTVGDGLPGWAIALAVIVTLWIATRIVLRAVAQRRQTALTTDHGALPGGPVALPTWLAEASSHPPDEDAADGPK